LLISYIDKSSPPKKQADLQTILSELQKLRAEMAPLKRLLTIEETGRYLAISPKTIRNQISRGAVKPFPVRPVKVSGRVLFRKDDLDKFIDGLAGDDDE